MGKLRKRGKGGNSGTISGKKKRPPGKGDSILVRDVNYSYVLRKGRRVSDVLREDAG